MKVIVADYSCLSDAEMIMQLMKIYALDPMGGGVKLEKTAEKNLISALIKINGAFSVLAIEAGEAIGLTNCLPGFSTFHCKPLINIHDLVVVKNQRGNKVAAKMLDLVEEVAIKRGCCKLTLEVLEGNKSAQKAYARFGFGAYELDPKMGKAMFWDKKINY